MSSSSIRTVVALAGSMMILAGPRSAMAQAVASSSHGAAAAMSDTSVGSAPGRTLPFATGAVLAIASDAAAPDARGPQSRPVALQASTRREEAPADADRDREVKIGSDLALVGVGAAAVVVGLLVGGDSGTVIAVGGGVIGLIGLYRYLR